MCNCEPIETSVAVNHGDIIDTEQNMVEQDVELFMGYDLPGIKCRCGFEGLVLTPGTDKVTISLVRGIYCPQCGKLGTDPVDNSAEDRG